MKNPRVDIASIRREQIVEAAVAVIAEQGLQNLSLSEIENKIDMSRGQLMYYFKTKEEILLAVFDRLLQLMEQRAHPGQCGPEAFAGMNWLDVIRFLLQMLLQQPPAHPEFHALQHTFLSQITHRDDFRQRLAKLYEHWRSESAAHLARDLVARPGVRPVSPRALATVVQAMLHGLAVQAAADPQAFDVPEVIDLTLSLITAYLWADPPPASKPRSRRLADAARTAP